MAKGGNSASVSALRRAGTMGAGALKNSGMTGVGARGRDSVGRDARLQLQRSRTKGALLSGGSPLNRRNHRGGRAGGSGGQPPLSISGGSSLRPSLSSEKGENDCHLKKKNTDSRHTDAANSIIVLKGGDCNSKFNGDDAKNSCAANSSLGGAESARNSLEQHGLLEQHGTAGVHGGPDLNNMVIARRKRRMRKRRDLVHRSMFSSAQRIRLCYDALLRTVNLFHMESDGLVCTHFALDNPERIMLRRFCIG